MLGLVLSSGVVVVVGVELGVPLLGFTSGFIGLGPEIKLPYCFSTFAELPGGVVVITLGSVDEVGPVLIDGSVFVVIAGEPLGVTVDPTVALVVVVGVVVVVVVVVGVVLSAGATASAGVWLVTLEGITALVVLLYAIV